MFKKLLSSTVILCFFLTSLGPIPNAHADTVLGLPLPGTMVNLSPAYEPALIKGLTIHKDNPFLFDFIIDTGHSGLSGDALKNEGDRLVKYFFACLTVPEKDLWVNLSPYEKDRMIPQALGQTALGRDLLAQDYILKQLTASLIYPEKNLGKEFWDRVYAKSQQMFGTTQIPVNTFNKVWILADKATVYEHGQTAFVIDGHLKVMLDEDYLALQKHSAASPLATRNDTHSIGANIVRQIILPELENEVNTGKNFAMLRQIFNSQILATWYKKNLKEALLNQVYTDKSTVKGVNLADPSIKERIYQQYLKAYKKGVFNYIKEETNTTTQETIPRKYFSGGYAANAAMLTTIKSLDEPGFRSRVTRAISGLILPVAFTVLLSTSALANPVNPTNAAMQSSGQDASEEFRGFVVNGGLVMTLDRETYVTPEVSNAVGQMARQLDLQETDPNDSSRIFLKKYIFTDRKLLQSLKYGMPNGFSAELDSTKKHLTIQSSKIQDVKDWLGKAQRALNKAMMAPLAPETRITLKDHIVELIPDNWEGTLEDFNQQFNPGSPNANQAFEYLRSEITSPLVSAFLGAHLGGIPDDEREMDIEVDNQIEMFVKWLSVYLTGAELSENELIDYINTHPESHILLQSASWAFENLYNYVDRHEDQAITFGELIKEMSGSNSTLKPEQVVDIWSHVFYTLQHFKIAAISNPAMTAKELENIILEHDPHLGEKDAQDIVGLIDKICAGAEFRLQEVILTNFPKTEIRRQQHLNQIMADFLSAKINLSEAVSIYSDVSGLSRNEARAFIVSYWMTLRYALEPMSTSVNSIKEYIIEHSAPPETIKTFMAKRAILWAIGGALGAIVALSALNQYFDSVEEKEAIEIARALEARLGNLRPVDNTFSSPQMNQQIAEINRLRALVKSSARDTNALKTNIDDLLKAEAAFIKSAEPSAGLTTSEQKVVDGVYDDLVKHSFNSVPDPGIGYAGIFIHEISGISRLNDFLSAASTNTTNISNKAMSVEKMRSDLHEGMKVFELISDNPDMLKRPEMETIFGFGVKLSSVLYWLSSQESLSHSDADVIEKAISLLGTLQRNVKFEISLDVTLGDFIRDIPALPDYMLQAGQDSTPTIRLPKTFRFYAQPGELLSDIARNFGTTVDALVRINKGSPDGEIYIPKGLNDIGFPSVRKMWIVTTARQFTYSVRPSDTLVQIADNLNVPEERIIKDNNLLEKAKLKFGQKLIINVNEAMRTVPGEVIENIQALPGPHRPGGRQSYVNQRSLALRLHEGFTDEQGRVYQGYYLTYYSQRTGTDRALTYPVGPVIFLGLDGQKAESFYSQLSRYLETSHVRGISPEREWPRMEQRIKREIVNFLLEQVSTHENPAFNMEARQKAFILYDFNLFLMDNGSRGNILFRYQDDDNLGPEYVKNLQLLEEAGLAEKTDKPNEWVLKRVIDLRIAGKLLGVNAAMSTLQKRVVALALAAASIALFIKEYRNYRSEDVYSPPAIRSKSVVTNNASAFMLMRAMEQVTIKEKDGTTNKYFRIGGKNGKWFRILADGKHVDAPADFNPFLPTNQINMSALKNHPGATGIKTVVDAQTGKTNVMIRDSNGNWHPETNAPEGTNSHNQAMMNVNRRQFLKAAASFLGLLNLPHVALPAEEPKKPQWSDHKTFQLYDKFRDDVRPATRIIIGNTLKTHLGGASKILEIGSGEGELYSLTPENMRKAFIQSDVVPENLARNPFDTPKKVIDVYNIPFETNSLPGVVSLAVLDTLDDLNRALKEIHRVLMKNGVMIGYTDLTPSHEVEMALSPDSVLFPAFSDIPGYQTVASRSYLRVNRKDLLEKIHEKGNSVNPVYLKSFNTYVANPIEEYKGIELAMEPSDQLEMSEIFKEVLTTLGVEYTKVNALDMFTKRLESAAEQAGFQLVESKIESGQAEVDRTTIKDIPDGKNVVVFHTGSKLFLYDPLVPKGKVRVESNISVIVAKKTSDTSKPGQGPVNPSMKGGIDLNSANMGMTVTKDANGGVKVNFDPAMIARIRQQGIQSAVPVIIDVHQMLLADIRPLLGLNNS